MDQLRKLLGLGKTIIASEATIKSILIRLPGIRLSKKIAWVRNRNLQKNSTMEIVRAYTVEDLAVGKWDCRGMTYIARSFGEHSLRNRYSLGRPSVRSGVANSIQNSDGGICSLSDRRSCLNVERVMANPAANTVRGQCS